MSDGQDRMFVAPADGLAIPNPVGGQMLVKLRDSDTHGAYSVHDNVIPAGSPGPRPHRHRRHDEVFSVLEGTLTVRIEARTITAPSGSFVLVPRGLVHQPSHPTAEPMRVLLMFSPVGMDDFFTDGGRSPNWSRPPTALPPPTRP